MLKIGIKIILIYKIQPKSDTKTMSKKTAISENIMSKKKIVLKIIINFGKLYSNDLYQ